MASSSKNYDDDIAGMWRGSAKYKVVYTEDFPAALLTGTEFPDNSLAKGRATKIEWIFDTTNPRAGTFTIRDNGVGIEGQSDLIRFCTIGSKESSDAHHRYAQGRICAMTTFMPDYETAEWTVTFKFDGHTTMLNQISHPWSTSKNMQRSMVKIPIDDTNRDLGFEMKMTFDTSIFGEELASDPRKLFAKTKERLTSKYTQSVFDKTEFVLTVKNATQTITESSRANSWNSLEPMYSSCCETVFDETFPWKSIRAHVTEYNLKTFKSKEPAAVVALREAFPTFGTRSIPSTRVHIINDDRLIESRHKSKMDFRGIHNSQNGNIVFIKTYSTGAGCDFNDQPEPSTIKVSIVDDCANLAGIYQMYRDEKKRRAEEARVKAAEEAKEKAVKAAKERADKAAKERAEKAAKDAATREAIAKAAKEVSTKKLTKPLRKMEVAGETRGAAVAGGDGGGGGGESQQSDDDEPMPGLDVIIPTFPSHVIVPLTSLASLASPSPATTPATTPVTPALPKSHFTTEDMKEVLRMSLTHVTSAEAQATLKAQVMEKYGFNDL